jgi:hypothetical protein
MIDAMKRQVRVTFPPMFRSRIPLPKPIPAAKVIHPRRQLPVIPVEIEVDRKVVTSKVASSMEEVGGATGRDSKVSTGTTVAAVAVVEAAARTADSGSMASASADAMVEAVVDTGSRVGEAEVEVGGSNIRPSRRHRATRRFLATCRIRVALAIWQHSMRWRTKCRRAVASRCG